MNAQRRRSELVLNTEKNLLTLKEAKVFHKNFVSYFVPLHRVRPMQKTKQNLSTVYDMDVKKGI